MIAASALGRGHGHALTFCRFSGPSLQFAGEKLRESPPGWALIREGQSARRPTGTGRRGKGTNSKFCALERLRQPVYPSLLPAPIPDAPGGSVFLLRQGRGTGAAAPAAGASPSLQLHRKPTDGFFESLCFACLFLALGERGLFL